MKIEFTARYAGIMPKSFKMTVKLSSGKEIVLDSFPKLALHIISDLESAVLRDLGREGKLAGDLKVTIETEETTETEQTV